MVVTLFLKRVSLGSKFKRYKELYVVSFEIFPLLFLSHVIPLLGVNLCISFLCILLEIFCISKSKNG